MPQPISRGRALRIGTALLTASIACGAAAAAGAGALPSSARWQPGVNYTVISPAQPVNAPPGKVQVMQFLWLGCPVCYGFEPYIRAWRAAKPAYIQFVRVPVMWDAERQAHARLFYTLEALGRDDLIETAFETLHRLEVQSGTEQVMIGSTPDQTFELEMAFAERQGIGAAAFASAYNSFDVNTELDHAAELGNTYRILGIPTIVVDGRYLTNLQLAGGHRQLISLIDFLAKWDHDHRH